MLSGSRLGAYSLSLDLRNPGIEPIHFLGVRLLDPVVPGKTASPVSTEVDAGFALLEKILESARISMARATRMLRDPIAMSNPEKEDRRCQTRVKRF